MQAAMSGGRGQERGLCLPSCAKHVKLYKYHLGKALNLETLSELAHQEWHLNVNTFL